MAKNLYDVAALGSAVHRLNFIAEHPLVSGLDAALLVFLEDNIFFVDGRHKFLMMNLVKVSNLDKVFLLTQSIKKEMECQGKQV
jgi:hypothetical protein